MSKFHSSLSAIYQTTYIYRAHSGICQQTRLLDPKVHLMELGILLHRGIEDVDGPAGGLVTGGDIVTLLLLCERVDEGDLIGSQLDVDKVLLDTGGVDGLGDDAVAADLGPGETESEEKVRSIMRSCFGEGRGGGLLTQLAPG